MARFKNSAESSVVMRKSKIAYLARYFFELVKNGRTAR
ncbi:hypothetical protein ABIF64_003187 [Bradyrhizobium japonicum]